MITKKLKDCGDQLPVGVLLPVQGGGFENVREFALRPVTGRLRLALGRKDAQDNPGKRNTLMLSLLLSRLGPLEAVTDDVIRKMTFADREFLLWRIQLDRMEADSADVVSICACGSKTEVSVPADDLLVNVLEDDDAEVAGDQRRFTFTHETYGTLVLRLANGADEERIAPLYGSNVEEAQLRELHNVILQLGTGTGRPTWEQYLDLPAKVLEWIGECANSLDIGATQRVNVTCQSCGDSNMEVLSPFDFSLTSSEATPVRPPYEIKSSG